MNTMKLLTQLIFLTLMMAVVGCNSGLTEAARPDGLPVEDETPADDDNVSDDDDSEDSLSDDDDSEDSLSDDDDTEAPVGDDDDATEAPVSDDDDSTPSLGDDDDSVTAMSAACSPVSAVACGMSISGNSTGAGALNDIGAYSCSGWDASGPEVTYSFVATSTEEVNVALNDIQSGEDLDVYVIEGGGSGCHSDSCVAYGNTETSFDAVAGQTYYFVVDGYYGAAGTFVLDIECGVSLGDDDDTGGSTGDDDDTAPTTPTPTPNVEDCTDGLDNDVDGLFDCDDSDCATDLVCMTGVCSPASTLLEGQSHAHSTLGAGVTNAITNYPCQPSWNESGPEFAYVYTATANGQATVNLNVHADSLFEILFGSFDDLDVFVLNNSGSCAPGNCIAGHDDSVSWPVTAGSVWYIIVDGFEGGAAPYDITLTHVPTGTIPPTVGLIETDCADGFDEDGDGAIDCADSDCVADPVCSTTAPGGTGATCQEDWDLYCGDTDSWNNSNNGSTSQVNSYSCNSWDASGPEYTYSFVPTTTGSVTFALSGMTEDLDLFVLDNASSHCDGSSCVNAGLSQVTFTAQAGQLYYVVVDGYQGAVSSYDLSVTCN